MRKSDTFVIVRTGEHVDVSSIGNGEDVRRHLATPLAAVQFGAPVRVHGKSFVGIDSHAKQAGVGLQERIGCLKIDRDAIDQDTRTAFHGSAGSCGSPGRRSDPETHVTKISRSGHS